MAVYRLDVEKRFGQLQLRLYPQGAVAPAFGPPCPTVKALIEAFEDAVSEAEPKPGEDTIVFRNIAYDDMIALRETVRLSRY